MIYVDWYDMAFLVYQHNLNIALSSLREPIAESLTSTAPSDAIGVLGWAAYSLLTLFRKSD